MIFSLGIWIAEIVLLTKILRSEGIISNEVDTAHLQVCLFLPIALKLLRMFSAVHCERVFENDSNNHTPIWFFCFIPFFEYIVVLLQLKYEKLRTHEQIKNYTIFAPFLPSGDEGYNTTWLRTWLFVICVDLSLSIAACVISIILVVDEVNALQRSLMLIPITRFVTRLVQII